MTDSCQVLSDRRIYDEHWSGSGVEHDELPSDGRSIDRPESAVSTGHEVVEAMGIKSMVVYVLVMIVVIVGVDVLFLRDRFGERLIANIGIVLMFAVVYLVVLKNR